MRQVREILRLRYEQRLAHRAIARACGVGLGTVTNSACVAENVAPFGCSAWRYTAFFPQSTEYNVLPYGDGSAESLTYNIPVPEPVP